MMTASTPRKADQMTVSDKVRIHYCACPLPSAKKADPPLESAGVVPDCQATTERSGAVRIGRG